MAFYCSLCDLQARTDRDFNLHVLGLKEVIRAREEGGGQEASAEFFDAQPPYFCEVCHYLAPSKDALQAHSRGYMHKARQLKQHLTKGKEAATAFADKQGITATLSIVPDIITQGSSHTALLQLANVSNSAHTFAGCTLLPTLPDIHILHHPSAQLASPAEPQVPHLQQPPPLPQPQPQQQPPALPKLLLPAGSSLTLIVRITPQQLGILSTLLVLDFTDAEGRSVVITRQLGTKCDIEQVGARTHTHTHPGEGGMMMIIIILR